MNIPSPYRRAVAAGAVALLGLLSVGIASTAEASVLAGDPVVVFDAGITPLPGNVPSLGYQATQTAEFGDAVHLSGTNRVLQSATVTMSDWALASTYNDSSPTWTHPITFNVYNYNATDAGTVGPLIGTVTQTVTIPYRPEADPTCPGRTAWRFDADTCFNGVAFNVTFDLSSIGTVPDEIVYGIAYSTNTWGASPIGRPGPYESLNVGLNTSTPNTIGDIDPNSVFWNTMTPGNYTDGGTGGIGTFRQDTGWLPYRPAVTFTASAGSCLFNTSGTTMTLQNNCTTDQTILVPMGMTLDGNGHSITAVDPVGGHFVGAVVANAGESANVTNLTVTTFQLANVCDGAADRLRGIMLDGASGSITNNTVVGIKQGASGCQEGNAIDVRNEPFTGAHPAIKAVTISGNTISDYQKTGIVANGDVLATITNNTVTGAGPINYIAQNGIQVGFGASATVKGNTVSANWYTPVSYVACGVLLYRAGGVRASSNTLFANERDNCNFGKGGGKAITP